MLDYHAIEEKYITAVNAAKTKSIVPLARLALKLRILQSQEDSQKLQEYIERIGKIASLDQLARINLVEDDDADALDILTAIDL